MIDSVIAIKQRTARLTWLAALSGLLALATGGCESPTNGGIGMVRLYVARASTAATPAMDPSLAEPPTLTWTDPAVTVMSIALIPGGFEVANFAPDGQSFPLVETGNGVGELLGLASVPGGVYQQVRLMMPSVSVLLEGQTERTTVPVPSGTQTGIKITLAEPLHLEDGATVDVVLTFDLEHSFVVHGPPADPSLSFRPVIHATVTAPPGP